MNDRDYYDWLNSEVRVTCALCPGTVDGTGQLCDDCLDARAAREVHPLRRMATAVSQTSQTRRVA